MPDVMMTIDKAISLIESDPTCSALQCKTCPFSRFTFAQGRSQLYCTLLFKSKEEAADHINRCRCYSLESYRSKKLAGLLKKIDVTLTDIIVGTNEQ